MEGQHGCIRHFALCRCIQTNREQCALLTSSFEKISNSAFRASGVLQLAKTGPLATKNFPLLGLFPSDAMMA